MSKKMKVLIAVLVAILTLTVSGVVIALAQENEEVEIDEEEELLEDVNEIAPKFKLFIATESNELLSRVAEILGISEADLSEAFAQAKREILEERSEQAFYDFLERAVEEGLITEEEAEEIMEWRAQKPDALTWNLLRKGFSIKGFYTYPDPEYSRPDFLQNP